MLAKAERDAAFRGMGAEIADASKAMRSHIVDSVQPSVFLRLDSLWTVNAEKRWKSMEKPHSSSDKMSLITRLQIVTKCHHVKRNDATKCH
jgi:hypothetical protein